MAGGRAGRAPDRGQRQTRRPPLARWPVDPGSRLLLATASAVVLLGDYALAVVISPGARGPVPVVFGSGLLLAAELAAWSIDQQGPEPEPAPVVWHRARMLAVLILGSAVFSVTVVAAPGELGDRQGLLIRGAGVAAAVAVVAMLAWLAIRCSLRPGRSV
jgi:hypothetical protein